jgi:hypothetical protein
VQARGLSGLDHGHLDRDHFDVAAGVHDRFVAEAPNDELQQRADVVVRFADEHTCHGNSIVVPWTVRAAGMV